MRCFEHNSFLRDQVFDDLFLESDEEVVHHYGREVRRYAAHSNRVHIVGDLDHRARHAERSQGQGVAERAEQPACGEMLASMPAGKASARLRRRFGLAGVAQPLKSLLSSDALCANDGCIKFVAQVRGHRGMRSEQRSGVPTGRGDATSRQEVAGVASPKHMILLHWFPEGL